MLPLLLFHCFCGWWSFSEEDFEAYESQSMEQPIFAVCTSQTCPHCRGLPDRLHSFSDSLGNSSNVIFTNIDCSTSYVCGQARIAGVPTFLLIRGRSSKYWTTTYVRSSGEWASFLESQLGPTAREITSDADLSAHISRTTEGATSFRLTLPESDAALLKAYQQLSGNLRVFGGSFGYTFGPESKAAEITAFFSPVCAVMSSVNADNIGAFLNRYRFSDFHHYDMMEWEEQSRDHLFGLVIVSEELKDSQKRAFHTFSKRLCNRMRFGWGSVRTDLDLFRTTNVEAEEAPFLYVTGQVNREQCTVISKKRIGDVSQIAILEGVIEGKSCSNATMIEEPAMTEKPKEEVTIVGPYFICFGVGSVVLGLVSLIRPFIHRDLSKLE
jgi:hypothetical protein